MILSFPTDWSGQIVKTQIRLLLQEQSDQGLHYLQYCLHFLDALPYGKTSFFSFRMITAKFFSARKLRNFTVSKQYSPRRASSEYDISGANLSAHRNLTENKGNPDFSSIQNGCPNDKDGKSICKIWVTVCNKTWPEKISMSEMRMNDSEAEVNKSSPFPTLES